jgi:hypothetical protein
VLARLGDEANDRSPLWDLVDRCLTEGGYALWAWEQLMDVWIFTGTAANIVIAIGTAIAAIAAWKAAMQSKSAAAEMRKASTADLAMRLRDQQHALSLANETLSNFLREYKGSFLIHYRSLRERNRDSKKFEEIEVARRNCKNYFRRVALLIELGVLDDQQAKHIVSASSA